MSHKTIDYITTLACHKMLPFITLPTRITSHSATLIDHIFVRFDKTDRPICSGNFFCSITDHLPNFAIIDIGKPAHSKLPRRKIRLFSEKNMLNFATMIYDTDWMSEFELYDDIDDLCDFFSAED